MNNLIEDISKLTTIPDKVLNKLVSKSFYCISDIIEDAILENKKVVEIEIGIGTLYLELNSDNVRYKFIPNKELESAVKNTIVNKRNLLQDTLEMILVNRVTDTYKELV
jgi:hypothetical protein